jgi:4-carboxymuconolactone decarboxylase
MDTREARLERGRARRRELWGPEPPLDPSDPAYELQELMTEVLFGEVWSRPGLDVRSREIATLAALTVLGREPQLRSHIQAALNIGLTRQEITEILMQMAFYGGLPAALNALRVAREVFTERGIQAERLS